MLTDLPAIDTLAPRDIVIFALEIIEPGALVETHLHTTRLDNLASMPTVLQINAWHQCSHKFVTNLCLCRDGVEAIPTAPE